jgi:predicted nucleic acid-binding protein
VILVDTNVLVALVLQREALHHQAVRDLERLRKETFFVTRSVLSEACFLLGLREQRARLRALLTSMSAREPGAPAWDHVFAWLERYADHEPDWADACLVVLSNGSYLVWTYDREFRTIWRRLDGSRVPLATRTTTVRARP